MLKILLRISWTSLRTIGLGLYILFLCIYVLFLLTRLIRLFGFKSAVFQLQRVKAPETICYPKAYNDTMFKAMYLSLLSLTSNWMSQSSGLISSLSLPTISVFVSCHHPKAESKTQHYQSYLNTHKINKTQTYCQTQTQTHRKQLKPHITTSKI